MNEPADTIEDVKTTAAITAGRVSIGVENEPATLALTTPTYEPLSRQQRVASLTVNGDGFDVAVRLDADDAATLARVLADVTDGRDTEAETEVAP